MIWEEFLEYLNEISGTNDFDDVGGINEALEVKNGVQIISDILWKMVYRNPAFRARGTDVVGSMMEKDGWYLESTIFDDSREVDPYIFYAMTQQAENGNIGPSLFAIWFTYDKDQVRKAISSSHPFIWETRPEEYFRHPTSTLVVQKWQLVYQTYKQADDGTWREDIDDPDEEPDESGWADPGYSYIFSRDPLVRLPVFSIINFPYNILFEV